MRSAKNACHTALLAPGFSIKKGISCFHSREEERKAGGERGGKKGGMGGVPRASTGGMEMTLTELSAEPERTRSEEGLNPRLVTGKSCALRIVMMD